MGSHHSIAFPSVENPESRPVSWLTLVRAVAVLILCFLIAYKTGRQTESIFSGCVEDPVQSDSTLHKSLLRFQVMKCTDLVLHTHAVMN